MALFGGPLYCLSQVERAPTTGTGAVVYKYEVPTLLQSGEGSYLIFITAMGGWYLMVRHRGLVRLSDLSKVLPLATWLQAKDCGPGSLIPVCILLTTPLFHVYYLSVQTGVSENGVFSGSPR